MTGTVSMRRLCIYSTIGTPARQVQGRYVVEALRRYRTVCDRLIFVSGLEEGDAYFDDIRAAVDATVHLSGAIDSSLRGYRAAFATLTAADIEGFDEIVFADSSTFVIAPLASMLDDERLRQADFWSVAYFLGKKDPRIASQIDLDQVMTFGCFGVSRKVATSQAFRSFMREDSAYRDYLHYRIAGEYRLHAALKGAGFLWQAYLDPEQFHTIEPMLFEAEGAIDYGCPFVLRNIFTLDPLTSDMQAIDARGIIDKIRKRTDFDIRLIWESILPYYPLRLLQSNMDEMRIIDSESPWAGTGKWNFGGKVAVIAHVFYIDMLDEFCEVAANVPCDFDFLITTSSEENRRQIVERLASFETGGRKEVRVVEQNRGRDMASLFITFRDLMTNGEYAWALRLHSKRTPQVAWHIGRSFKRHLIHNLIPSRNFVSRLFDLLEKPEYADVGVVVPPVIQIAFGTLGHSWFNNKRGVEELARDMDIDVPLDEHTPVAPYGTMYWFRPDALRPIFEREWQWEEYNAEPNHVDGGLAHIQERLICYCAQHQGYRTLSIMSSDEAERNYLKLEYKLQRLASCFPVSDIRMQCELAGRMKWSPAGRYTRLLTKLEEIDGAVAMATPRLWKFSRSIVLPIWNLLTYFDAARRQSESG